MIVCQFEDGACTNSKEKIKSPTTTTIDSNQQLINDHFRKWIEFNRPKADEYVLNDITSTAQEPNDIDDYRRIVNKALDLLVERHDLNTTGKLSKLVQKEVSLASPKKISHTIDILKQTAEKLRHGKIILDSQQQPNNNYQWRGIKKKKTTNKQEQRKIYVNENYFRYRILGKHRKVNLVK